MTSSRPYLLRAMYDWIVDNGFTPYVVVNASWTGVQVPLKYVKDNRIVLNIAVSATHKLILGNDAVQFDGRFDGVIWNIYLPIGGIVAIYAQENGRGMVFDESDTDGETDSGNDNPPPPPAATPTKSGTRPQLKIVK